MPHPVSWAGLVALVNGMTFQAMPKKETDLFLAVSFGSTDKNPAFIRIPMYLDSHHRPPPISKYFFKHIRAVTDKGFALPHFLLAAVTCHKSTHWRAWKLALPPDMRPMRWRRSAKLTPRQGVQLLASNFNRLQIQETTCALSIVLLPWQIRRLGWPKGG